MTGASIILPIHNEVSQHHIKSAISSVVGQSYQPIELIIVNDGCEDLCHWLQDFCKSINKKIKIISTSTRGLGNAINEGVLASSYPIIFRMDSDDEMLPDRVAAQMDVLLARQQDHLILGGNAIIINEFGEETGEYKKAERNRSNQLISYFGSPFIHPTIALRRKTFDLIGGYANIGPSQDYEFFLRARKHGVIFENLPINILRYRIQIHSESRRYDFRKVVNGYIIRSHQWINDPKDFRIRVTLAANQRRWEHPSRTVARLISAKYRNEGKLATYILYTFMLAILKREYALEFISNLIIKVIMRVQR